MLSHPIELWVRSACMEWKHSLVTTPGDRERDHHSSSRVKAQIVRILFGSDVGNGIGTVSKR